MTDNTPAPAIHPLYVLQVLAALLAVGLGILAAFWLAHAGASWAQQQAAIAVLVALALALVPGLRWVYLRRDELQRLHHQQACVTSMAILASACAVLGILQANQLLPLFNQFWTFGLLIAVWGVQLMLADRRYL